MSEVEEENKILNWNAVKERKQRKEKKGNMTTMDLKPSILLYVNNMLFKCQVWYHGKAEQIL